MALLPLVRRLDRVIAEKCAYITTHSPLFTEFAAAFGRYPGSNGRIWGMTRNPLWVLDLTQLVGGVAQFDTFWSR